MESLDSELNSEEREILKFLLSEYKKTGKFLSIEETKKALGIQYDEKIEEKIIKQFARRGFPHVRLSPNQEVLFNYIIEQYSKYDSIHTFKEIERNLRFSDQELDDALSKLERIGIITKEKNRDEKIIPRMPKIGYEHITTLEDGRILSPIEASCAIDALGLPFTYNQDATINSKDPISNQEIKIEIKDERIASQQPKNLVVYLGSQCSTTLFFTSEENLKEWEKRHPNQNGTSVNMEKALELGRKLFENRLEIDYKPSCEISLDEKRQNLTWENIPRDDSKSN
ncbi:MAG: alkylmercury lyase family protein [Promethearchaeota archaeon]